MTDSERFDLLLTEMRGMKGELQSLNNKVSALDDKVVALDNKVSALDNRVAVIELTLENKIIPDIKGLADGQLGLARNLEEVLATVPDKEKLVLRVDVAENEIRRIKARLKKSAM